MNQYCLNCGHRLETQIIENRERDVCPVCGRINYVQLKVTAGMLVVQASKLLLVQRAIEPWKGYWYLPAGYVENDETPIHAAEREAQEETGLEINAENLEDIYFYNDDPRGNGLLILYSGRVAGGKIKINSEAEEIRFFYPDEINSLKLAGGSHNIAIRDWLTKLSEAGVR
jgi:ADP-ribose pyrophosphatase YjhB (NUDIX family)